MEKPQLVNLIAEDINVIAGCVSSPFFYNSIHEEYVRRGRHIVPSDAPTAWEPYKSEWE
ncbi:hypothetical protein KC957_03740 [Candidatus Saccharibacteria bacterium]|nr:hypothetical protein [Candidatus Saccharibacteria bacterium]